MKNPILVNELAEAALNWRLAKALYDETGQKQHRWLYEEAEDKLKETVAKLHYSLA
jgi:hypothetical protein